MFKTSSELDKAKTMPSDFNVDSWKLNTVVCSSESVFSRVVTY